MPDCLLLRYSLCSLLFATGCLLLLYLPSLPFFYCWLPSSPWLLCSIFPALSLILGFYYTSFPAVKEDNISIIIIQLGLPSFFLFLVPLSLQR